MTSKNDSIASSNFYRIGVPLILFGAALLIRIVYLQQIQEMPTFETVFMDERYHVELADQINSPEGYPDEPFFRAPLYPYTLAMLFTVTGKSFYWTRFIQSIVGSFIPVIIFLLGLRLFDRRTGLIAGIVAVFYPTFIYYDSALLITFLITLLSLLLLWWLSRLRYEKIIDYIFLGLLLGVAGLARPNILLFGPLLLIWFWIVIKPQLGLKRTLVRYVVVGLTAVIVILPVTIRNYKVSNEFILIAWQGGVNFFIGNNTESNGWAATLPGLDNTWEGSYNQAIAYAEAKSGKRLSPSEVSSFWYDMAWEEIDKDPGHFIGLLFRKARLLINGYEIPNNQNIYFVREYAGFMKPLLFNSWLYFPFGFVVPLALVGLFFSRKKWKTYLPCYLFILAYGGSFIFFFICARFRQPLVPLFILFAVYGLLQLIELIRKTNMKRLLVPGLILVLFLAESNHAMLGLDSNRTLAEDYHLMGVAYLERNNLARAEAEFNKSVSADPSYARSYNNLGLVYGRRGNHAKAADYFFKALTADPSIAESYVNYATTQIVRKRYEDAIRILHDAKSRFPLNDYIPYKLAMTYYELGQFDMAKTEIETALLINPNNQSARDVYREIMRMIQKP